MVEGRGRHFDHRCGPANAVPVLSIARDPRIFARLAATPSLNDLSAAWPDLTIDGMKIDLAFASTRARDDSKNYLLCAAVGRLRPVH